VSYHVTCPDYSYDTTTAPSAFLWTDLQQIATVSADGMSMVGSQTMDGGAGSTYTLEWNLHAQREP
jgi:hypothetical protein